MAATTLPAEPLTVTKPLRHVVNNILCHDLAPHEVRAGLLDWQNESEDDYKLLLAHAKAVLKGQPIRSYVESAQLMSAIVSRIL